MKRREEEPQSMLQTWTAFRHAGPDQAAELLPPPPSRMRGARCCPGPPRRLCRLLAEAVRAARCRRNSPSASSHPHASLGASISPLHAPRVPRRRAPAPVRALSTLTAAAAAADAGHVAAVAAAAVAAAAVADATAAQEPARVVPRARLQPPVRASPARASPAAAPVTAPQSTQQTWTVLQYHGSDHLGLWVHSSRWPEEVWRAAGRRRAEAADGLAREQPHRARPAAGFGPVHTVVGPADAVGWRRRGARRDPVGGGDHAVRLKETCLHLVSPLPSLPRHCVPLRPSGRSPTRRAGRRLRRATAGSPRGEYRLPPYKWP